MFILDDILMLPARGLIFVFEKIYEEAMREYQDVAAIQRKLIDLELLYELGEIEEDEYEQTQEKLIARLQEIWEMQKANEEEVSE
ncbi:MAG: gas vesicle protein GvpG [Bacillota bacterium]